MLIIDDRSTKVLALVQRVDRTILRFNFVIEIRNETGPRFYSNANVIVFFFFFYSTIFRVTLFISRINDGAVVVEGWKSRTG